jgi:hypothetical protein
MRPSIDSTTPASRKPAYPPAPRPNLAPSRAWVALTSTPPLLPPAPPPLPLRRPPPPFRRSPRLAIPPASPPPSFQPSPPNPFSFTISVPSQLPHPHDISLHTPLSPDWGPAAKPPSPRPTQ